MSNTLTVFYAGVSWDGIQGTDHRLVEHLSRVAPVLWIDPPRPITAVLRRKVGLSKHSPRPVQISPNLWRLQLLVAPGVTRPGLRDLSQLMVRVAARRGALALGFQRITVVASNPETQLRRIRADKKILLLTDDFVQGASLLGLSESRAKRIWETNLSEADEVLAVSPELVSRVSRVARKVTLFPNGCSPERFPESLVPAELDMPKPRAGVVGQLNERLDTQLLLLLVENGINLVLIGPRYERNPAVRDDLDRIIGHSNTLWIDRQPYDTVPALVSSLSIGLTPYLDTSFNRASFPLKTLEYLAAGKPVVSTDLPASRWLGTPAVEVAQSHADFVALVRKRLSQETTEDLSRLCRRVAAENSWSARATQLAAIIMNDSTIDRDTKRNVASPFGAIDNG